MCRALWEYSTLSHGSAGVSETAIRNHLRRGEPKISSLRAIARATKFSAQWLVEGEEQEGSRSEAANVSALNDLLKIPRSEH